MFDELFSRINVYKKGLQASAFKNKVIASNIANIDTKGYKSKNIDFNEFFSEYLNRKKVNNQPEQYLKTTGFTVRETAGLSIKSDGNNVDMEKEMTSLVENSMMYNLMVSSINSRFNLMRKAINEGKG